MTLVSNERSSFYPSAQIRVWYRAMDSNGRWRRRCRGADAGVGRGLFGRRMVVPGVWPNFSNARDRVWYSFRGVGDSVDLARNLVGDLPNNLLGLREEIPSKTLDIFFNLSLNSQHYILHKYVVLFAEAWIR